MGSFTIHVIEGSKISELGTILGNCDGKELSVVVALGSPVIAEKVIESFLNLKDFRGSVVLSTGDYHQNHLDQLQSVVFVTGSGNIPPVDRLLTTIGKCIMLPSLEPIMPIHFVKEVRNKLHDQVSPYGPQKRKAFRGK
jgi:hypothetical protein